MRPRRPRSDGRTTSSHPDAASSSRVTGSGSPRTPDQRCLAADLLNQIADLGDAALARQRIRVGRPGRANSPSPILTLATRPRAEWSRCERSDFTVRPPGSNEVDGAVTIRRTIAPMSTAKSDTLTYPTTSCAIGHAVLNDLLPPRRRCVSARKVRSTLEHHRPALARPQHPHRQHDHHRQPPSRSSNTTPRERLDGWTRTLATPSLEIILPSRLWFTRWLRA
jgi:hypothetical protein